LSAAVAELSVVIETLLAGVARLSGVIETLSAVIVELSAAVAELSAAVAELSAGVLTPKTSINSSIIAFALSPIPNVPIRGTASASSTA
jgi:methyl-accepting chemotaxis protein